MKNLTVTILFCISLFLISCSSGLRRGNAKEQIITQLKLPTACTQTLHEYDSYCKELISRGLFTEQKKEEEHNSNVYSSRGGVFIPQVSVQLGFPYDITEEGKKYLVQFDGDYNPIVKLGILNFDEITGISDNDEFNKEVHYTLKCTDLTPFGEILLGTNSIQKVAYFKKYDDGWRIQ